MERTTDEARLSDLDIGRHNPTPPLPSVASLLAEVRSCTLCSARLPLGPRPVLQLHSTARILIAAQAPGTKVHETGVPFDDASGERLRRWLGVTRQQFYDPGLFAIVPMGLCYPGKGSSGDLPPRPECAPRWRLALLQSLEQLQLTLVIGQHAARYHLPAERAGLTHAVRNWRRYWPSMVPMPHPSPTNNGWLAHNRWFENELVPSLQVRVAEVLRGDGRPLSQDEEISAAAAEVFAPARPIAP